MTTGDGAVEAGRRPSLRTEAASSDGSRNFVSLIKQKILMKAAVNKYPYNERDHWISYSKCELCKVCNMPLLSHEFAERLAG